MTAAQHERLTALFTEAIDLPAGEREKLIERVRGEDRAIADELAALLAADEKIDTLGITPALRGPRPDLEVPGYRVLDVIGEGGMGTVYAAEQAEPRRRVAIKVLLARSPNAVARFRAEAAIMARLDHSGIARVLEAGESNGSPFLVMEHVDGMTLDEAARSMTRERKLRLFLAICDAVHHAHLKGVIHRDLKPSNVMVRADGRVVVLDFGVARLAADDGSTPGNTRAGELIGTPLYMSPEQAQMRAQDVDARSDLYTLGVMLYELACGELPYDIKDLPLPGVTVVITEDPPLPLGKRDPALAGDLEAITDKALRKDPEDRYPSVAALAEDVRRYLDGEAVSVRVPGRIERTRRFIKRRPVVAATIAGGALAATTFGIAITALWLEARAARHAAEAARGDLEVRANQLVLGATREALSRDPSEALGWLATLTPRGVDAATAWDIFDEAIARGVATDVLAGHTDEVHWVEALPGGGFVSGGYDGKAIVWQAGVPRVVLTAKHGRVHAVRPAPGGQALAIGCDGGEAAVVTPEGRVLATLAGHEGDVQHIAWSSDGAWLVTADDHGNTWAWPKGMTPGRRLTDSHSPIGTLAFSDDGRALVASDHAGHVWVWSTDTWIARTAQLAGDPVTAWTDGARVAVVDGDGTVHRWHGDPLVEDAAVATKQRTKRAVFAKGGAWLLLGGVGGEVVRVEGTTIETLPLAHHGQVRSLAITDDGRWIADGSDDGTLVLRDRATGRDLVLRGHKGRIRHVELSGDALLTSDSEGVVRRWQLPAGAPALYEATAAVDHVATDGTWLGGVDERGDVWRWHLADGRRDALGHVASRITSLAVAGGTVVTASAEGDAVFWTAPPVTRHIGGSLTAVAAASDRVAVTGTQGTIALFSPAGEPLGTLPGNTGGTEAIAIAGDRIASGGQDRSVRSWSRDGTQHTYDGLAADIHYIAFARDTLIAAGNDGIVYAWPPGRQLAHHTGAASALAVQGGFVASAGRDHEVIVAPLAGEPHRVLLSGTATALAIDAGGGIHAVTKTGAVERGSGAGSVIELDHGARTALQLDADHWLVSRDDGAIVRLPLTTPPLDGLPAAIAAATHYRLGSTSALAPVAR
ncbi:MAG TPA: serine/threonine-protein kinase [Kofleriaceae bacterium]|nr:serine/threonine-protein kinase [Kofleriaceae bacterium]